MMVLKIEQTEKLKSICEFTGVYYYLNLCGLNTKKMFDYFFR